MEEEERREVLCHYSATVNFSDGPTGSNTEVTSVICHVWAEENLCVSSSGREEAARSPGLCSQNVLRPQSDTFIKGQVKVAMNPMQPVVRHRCSGYLITINYWGAVCSESIQTLCYHTWNVAQVQVEKEGLLCGGPTGSEELARLEPHGGATGTTGVSLNSGDFILWQFDDNQTCSCWDMYLRVKEVDWLMDIFPEQISWLKSICISSKFTTDLIKERAGRLWLHSWLSLSWRPNCKIIVFLSPVKFYQMYECSFFLGLSLSLGACPI